ncbi:MAG TPA: 2-C-methyl-D-erythritol 4-phosphate cytidylyltransferase [Mycobacteriales bacterium]|nr:2-C-methyl-D-erythritol 4-phosphate cytidylyltransferase [Mycobacteriales bacterium]
MVDSVVLASGSSAHDALHAALSRVDDADIVVLHDVHRPLAPPSLVVAVLAAVRAGADAALPVVEVTETVKEVDDAGLIVRTVPRESLVQEQFPRAVRGALLRAAHRSCAAEDPLIPAGSGVVTVLGTPDSVPVHDARDLEFAAAVRAVRAARG